MRGIRLFVVARGMALLLLIGSSRAEAGCATYVAIRCNSGGQVLCSGSPCGDGNALCITNPDTFITDYCYWYSQYGSNCQAALNGMIGMGIVCCGSIADCNANCSGGCGGW
jgi:hypothetical protein